MGWTQLKVFTKNALLSSIDGLFSVLYIIYKHLGLVLIGLLSYLLIQPNDHNGKAFY